MDGSTTNVHAVRVLALALITLLVAGLAYLRFAPDSSAVSVPKARRPATWSSSLAITRPRTATTPPNAARSSSRETGRPAVAPDRSAYHSNPRQVRSSSRADLRPCRAALAPAT